MSFFDTLATPVAMVLEGIHTGLSTVLPTASGWTWGLSIVLLTVTVRILLFPLFVKQIKSQRRMQELAPKIKVLQGKHKGDRETLNTELMKLYKDHGTNPISGCLPLILQLPVFFALFTVMNNFKPKSDGSFPSKFGLTEQLISEGAKAKVFGAPVASAFTQGADVIDRLGGDPTVVKIVATLMIVTMGATTFLTQKQMMARTKGQVTDPQQQQIQKIMLYVLPLSFAVFGFSFPIGVLLYWLTTNVWSMGQQAWVIKRMPPPLPGSATGKSASPTKDKPSKPGAGTSDDAAPDGDAPAPAGSATVTTGSRPGPRQGARPGGNRSAGSRKNKSRKGGRR